MLLRPAYFVRTIPRPNRTSEGRSVVKRVLVLSAMLLASAFLLTSCGGDEESEDDESAASAITCEGDALDGDTGLPAKFPTPSELTYVKTEQRGPTRVVNAYFEGSL